MKSTILFLESRTPAHHMSDTLSVPAEDVAAVQNCEKAYNTIRDELAKVIVGQQDVIEQVLIAVFAKGTRCSKAFPAWPRRC
jgi:hypothetical protein